MNSLLPFVILILVLFPLCWLGSMRAMRRWARLSSSIDAATGDKLAESGWGSASINGLSFSNCVAITRYQHGFEIRIMPVFGGGRLWLPFEQTAVVDSNTSGFLSRSYRQFTTNSHTVRVYGQLREFVVRPPVIMDET